MTNEEKLLQLVLQDENLQKECDIDASQYKTVDDAIRSEDPIISVIGTIIRKNGSFGSTNYRDLYKEVINHLRDNLL